MYLPKMKIEALMEYQQKEHEAECPNCGMWVDYKMKEYVSKAYSKGANIYVPTKATCIRCGKKYRWKRVYTFYDTEELEEIR